MGDHTHGAGGWMLSYRTMHMSMDGMRSGNDRVSSSQVFAEGYTVAPESMDMEMHMLGLMYAPTDDLTLMLMANYSEIEMAHRINPGAPAMLFNAVGGDTFTTHSSGIGDTKLTALYNLYRKEGQRFHLGLGLSLPTGSIDRTDNTPLPGMPPSFPKQELPAPMQLGSGTFDLLPSITYVQQFDDWSYGAQANAVIRLEDENENGYRLGNVLSLTSWLGYNLSDWIGLSAGLNYTSSGKLKGNQSGIGQTGPAGRSVTTAFNENYGGERIDALLGFNLYVPQGILKGHRLAADIRLPLWQDLNGLQLETDVIFTLGWQLAF